MISPFIIIIIIITSCRLGHPLASGFNLDDGKVSFTVPQVKPNNNYIVVREYLYYPVLPSSVQQPPMLTLGRAPRTVFGDSGNASPEFTIKK
jgi:hypothetical protein